MRLLWDVEKHNSPLSVPVRRFCDAQLRELTFRRSNLLESLLSFFCKLYSKFPVSFFYFEQIAFLEPPYRVRDFLLLVLFWELLPLVFEKFSGKQYAGSCGNNYDYSGKPDCYQYQFGNFSVRSHIRIFALRRFSVNNFTIVELLTFCFHECGHSSFV